jgi:hypothetical protein
MNNLRNRSHLGGHLPAGNRIGGMLTDSLQHHSRRSILEKN